MKLAIVYLCVTVFLPSCLGHYWFRDRIPNGHNVLNPNADPNNPDTTIWRGVGHLAPGGGGPRNPFGLDFKDNGLVWNEVLCMKDSDGDGRTNGEELCDPECTWTQGQPQPMCRNTPGSSAELPSHPGVCEPVNSAVCGGTGGGGGNGGGTDTFDCPDIKAPDVQKLTLEIPTTTLPAKETTYYCKLIALPTDRDYHVVATEPIIRSDVIHHIDVYGCTDKEIRDYNLQQQFFQGADCGGLASMYCSTMLGGWTVGYPGSCMYGENYGVRIGRTSYKMALVEFHWNNPELRPNLQDSSGMNLYYTPNLRQYDLGTLLVAQMFLNIPPQSYKHREQAVCSAGCTQRFIPASRSVFQPGCIYMVAANIHMHLLGDSGSIKIKRRGSPFYENIVIEPTFSYTTPVEHFFEEPVPICQGDEVMVECNFTSYGSGLNKFVHYGEGTNEEMCVGYLSYYPQMRNAPFCSQMGNVDFCETETEILGGDTPRGCNLNAYMYSADLWTLASEVSSAPACQMNGCSPACLQIIRCAQPRHPCLAHSDLRYTLSEYLVHDQDPMYQLLGSRFRACHDADPAGAVTCTAGMGIPGPGPITPILPPNLDPWSWPPMWKKK